MAPSGPDALASLRLAQHGDDVTFEVRVQPRARRTAWLGVKGTALRVALTAPPVEGAANEALRALVAETFGVPARAVGLVRGEKNRAKVVAVAGVTVAAARAVLLRVLAEQ